MQLAAPLGFCCEVPNGLTKGLVLAGGMTSFVHACGASWRQVQQCRALLPIDCFVYSSGMGSVPRSWSEYCKEHDGCCCT